MTQHFRSHWNPTIHDATKNAHRFLPTPVPVAAKVEEAPPVERSQPLLRQPPPEAREPGALCILDRYNDYRAYIAADGAAYNNRGQLLGYIDSDQVGDPTMGYLGCINADHQIENEDDDVIATLDPGTVRVKDGDGLSVASMNNAGQSMPSFPFSFISWLTCAVDGENGTYLGQFEGFTYHHMRVRAFLNPHPTPAWADHYRPLHSTWCCLTLACSVASRSSRSGAQSAWIDSPPRWACCFRRIYRSFCIHTYIHALASPFAQVSLWTSPGRLLFIGLAPGRQARMRTVSLLS